MVVMLPWTANYVGCVGRLILRTKLLHRSYDQLRQVQSSTCVRKRLIAATGLCIHAILHHHCMIEVATWCLQEKFVTLHQIRSHMRIAYCLKFLTCTHVWVALSMFMELCLPLRCLCHWASYFWWKALGAGLSPINAGEWMSCPST